MKKVAVLGSTGSIGTQTLDVIKANGDSLQVCSLVAYSNAAKLAEQSRDFPDARCALISQQGKECLLDAVRGADIAVVATRGISAIECILYCLDNGIDVALANKEALVCAGQLIMAKKGAKLLPVDSEHCAIMQCLRGREKRDVSELILTASGGPFWNVDAASLKDVTVKQALAHPNWNMGAKITVDSATMMNKSLEVIEASHLFGIEPKRIRIAVHRQSIVHSMVSFTDGSVMAQLAQPDMRLPIQTALLGVGKLQIQPLSFDMLTLTFEECNFDKFPCATLGYAVSEMAPLCATVMNAANDVCVESFLKGELCFTSFFNIISEATEHFRRRAENAELSVREIELLDEQAKQYARQLVSSSRF